MEQKHQHTYTGQSREATKITHAQKQNPNEVNLAAGVCGGVKSFLCRMLLSYGISFCVKLNKLLQKLKTVELVMLHFDAAVLKTYESLLIIELVDGICEHLDSEYINICSPMA